jgi:mannose-1-phosphate guanylyltransferase
MKSLILAAGFGTRLKPITEHLPKPIIPVFNYTPLLMNYNKIKKYTDNISVNSHHLNIKLKKYIFDNNLKINLSQENEILGVGGGIGRLKNHFAEDSVIIHNSDIITDLDISKLIDYHKTNNNWATLALINYPKINTVSVDKKNNITSFNNKTENSYTFSGVSIISKKIYEQLPENKFFNIITLYNQIISSENKHKIKGLFFNNVFWYDIGTLEQYWIFWNKIFENKLIQINASSSEFQTFKKCKSIFIKSNIDLSIKNSIVFDNRIIYTAK